MWGLEIQLNTRRAVMLGSQMDGLPYSIEGAPQAERILSEIYGVDFFKPPLDVQHTGVWPVDKGIQNLWAARTANQWMVLGKKFNFTQVLVPSDWTLQLRVVASNSDGTLYALPS